MLSNGCFAAWRNFVEAMKSGFHKSEAHYWKEEAKNILTSFFFMKVSLFSFGMIFLSLHEMRPMDVLIRLFSFLGFIPFLSEQQAM